MSYPVLFPIEDDTVPIPFATYDGGDGSSITASGLAVTDIEIHKDGSTTQRASDNGYTLLDTDGIDFDGLTGIHGFSIDLSDNSDAGFYEVGPWYWVIVSAITVDGQTVSFIAAMFRIVSATRGMAGTAVPAAAAGAAGGLPTDSCGKTSFNDLSAAAVNVEVDTALGEYDPPTKAELDGGLAALNDLSAADVNAEVDTALSDYDPPTKAELDGGLAGLNDPSTTEIRDAVTGGAYALDTDANGRVRVITFGSGGG